MFCNALKFILTTGNVNHIVFTKSCYRASLGDQEDERLQAGPGAVLAVGGIEQDHIMQSKLIVISGTNL